MTVAAKHEYAEKFESYRDRTVFGFLDRDQQTFAKKLAFAHRLTFQEFRRVAEVARDLDMWGEPGLEEWWSNEASRTHLTGIQLKKHLLRELDGHLARLKRDPKRYPTDGRSKPTSRRSKPIVTEQSDKTIWGLCPVASEKTVCCNLRTIDAVENCVFGCSYCTVQTFYHDNVVFDADFAVKLKTIELDSTRFYHIGTGQASDSLAFGNRNGVLDALCEFAADHPNVLLELKTKSDNVGYFLENEIPENVVCSWSLNTPAIVENEEHFTSDLDARLGAARTVADRGVGVAFHFHPMVYYQGWDRDYVALADRLIGQFVPEDVRFVSFGSVTLIKSVIQKIRELGNPTKILQMELVPEPHGKLTYNDDIKINMFRAMYHAFAPWRDRVFMYLCMEKRSIWERSFGYVYESNEEFEAEFGRRTLSRW
jgi:spore photoproduct lyase